MANTKTSKLASKKKATTKVANDVEEKVNVVDHVVEEMVEEVQADSDKELEPQGSDPDVNGDASNVEESEDEVQKSDETTEVTDDIDLPGEDDVNVRVSAEEVKDFAFDKFSDSDARQDEIIVPAPSVVREKDVYVAKPLFPPSKYTQKTIVKKYH